jgi:hypothetical protein
MFLKLTAGGELQFEDRQNFRALKLDGSKNLVGRQHF